MAAGAATGGPVGFGIAAGVCTVVSVIGIVLTVISIKGKLVIKCECENCNAHRDRRDGKQEETKDGSSENEENKDGSGENEETKDGPGGNNMTDEKYWELR